MANVVAKTAAALAALEADIEAKITAGALDITTNLSMGGAALAKVGGVRLGGGESAVIGTLYMDEELAVVTAAGVVQITSGGTLNVAALGTIGGDYGGENPASVTFDDISGEYRFNEDTSVWADLVAGDLVLKGAAGSVRVGVDAGVSGAKTFNFKSFPASGVGGLAFDAASNGLVDATVTRETATHLFTSISCSGTMTAATIKHGDQVISEPLTAFRVGIASGAGVSAADSVAGHPYTLVPATVVARWPITGLRAGNRVKKIKIHGIAGGASNPTITALSQTGVNSAPTLAHMSAGTFLINNYYEMTLDTPLTLASGQSVWVEITGGNRRLWQLRRHSDRGR
jgi:hypothetical protein